MEPLLPKAIEAYVHDHTRPLDPLFDELREVTYATVPSPQMQVGRVAGTFLKLLVRITGARRVLEIGTFTGFSGLCMAEGLPEDGELITCDIDPNATRIAREFFDRSPHGRKITIRLGNALETVRALPEEPPFDVVFIDADKVGYIDYYEASLPKVRKGGLIIADNALRDGKVLSPDSPGDHAIVAFNAHVNADARVENVLLSVRDGMMLAYKR
jgi:caffeoyl-CoA O-methyltransferase